MSAPNVLTAIVRTGRRLVVAVSVTLAIHGSSIGSVAAVDGSASRQLAQTDSGIPVRIAVNPQMTAQPQSQMPLPAVIAGDAPPNSFVRLRGLPASVSLSEGHAIAPGAWAIPLAALPSLKMNIPAGISGRSELTFSLVALDGSLLAETRTVLIVSNAPAAERRGDAAAKTLRPKPMSTPADREAAEKLVARGERDLQEGNISLARPFLQRAAEAGLARAALLLAATYDPGELARMRAPGVQPNLALARKWYERARELGATEAEERLTHLGGG